MRKRIAVSLLMLAALLTFFGAVPPSPAAPAEGPVPFGSPGTSSRGGHGMGLIRSRPDPRHQLDLAKYGAKGAVASSVDLTGNLPPIGDQGKQGSCVGWSTGYYYKTWWEKRERPQWDLKNRQYRFSPSFVFNQINSGNPNGSRLVDAFDLLEKKGDVDIEEFPYSDQNWTAQPSVAQLEAAKPYRIPPYESNGWGAFFVNMGYPPYWNDIGVLKSWLESGKPLVLGIPIFGDFPDYKGSSPSPFYDYDGYSPYYGGHAVLIAGYDDDAGGPGNGGFLTINSWGPGWNGGGRVYLSYNFVRTCVMEAWGMEDGDSTPRVASLSPSTAGPGSTLTINGGNFGAKRRKASVVFSSGGGGGFEGSGASITSWSDSQIKAKVPGNAATGKVYVYNWDEEKSNGGDFKCGPGPQTGWLLAEGTTWPGFDEWVLVQNPNGSSSRVSVKFLTRTGEINGPSLVVPARSRSTIHVNDFVRNQDVSTVISVTNGVTVCAERAMYVSTADGKWGSHDSIGAPDVAGTWYLAEGATWPGFDEWLLVMNPDSGSVDVAVTFQTPGGEVKGPDMKLKGRSRGTVHVNGFVPNSDVSAVVECRTPGKGVVAERSVYVNTADGRRGCHNSMGCTETAEGWGLAEGATWNGFEEWVLVQNPTDVPATVNFFFLTQDGRHEGPRFAVGPKSRISVRVKDYAANVDVSTLVLTETKDQKVVVERAVYMNTPDGKVGAHDSTGSVYANTCWYMPEGCTLPGFEEWVLVMNPFDGQINAKLTFMTPRGVVNGPGFTLPPYSRRTFRVNDYTTGNVSTVVESSNGYVVCERAMYVRTADGKGGAHDSLGVRSTYVISGAGGPGRDVEIADGLRSDLN